MTISFPPGNSSEIIRILDASAQSLVEKRLSPDSAGTFQGDIHEQVMGLMRNEEFRNALEKLLREKLQESGRQIATLCGDSGSDETGKRPRVSIPQQLETLLRDTASSILRGGLEVNKDAIDDLIRRNAGEVLANDKLPKILTSAISEKVSSVLGHISRMLSAQSDLISTLRGSDMEGISLRALGQMLPPEHPASVAQLMECNFRGPAKNILRNRGFESSTVGEFLERISEAELQSDSRGSKMGPKTLLSLKQTLKDFIIQRSV